MPGGERGQIYAPHARCTNQRPETRPADTCLVWGDVIGEAARSPRHRTEPRPTADILLLAQTTFRRVTPSESGSVDLIQICVICVIRG